MDRDVLMHQMTERFQEAFAKGLDALERAPDGQWIAASEFVFREAFLELMKETYQAAVQARIDAEPSRHAGTFSPSEPGGGGCGAVAQQG